jgi:hypothetical protein
MKESEAKKHKRIHGAPQPVWEKFGLNEFPPVECKFKVGDKVTYTNDAGLKFDMDVVGFSEDDRFYGRFIHLVRHGSDGEGSAWWFPHHPSEVRKEDGAG